MISQKDAGKSLVYFTDDVGISEHLVVDGATEFTGQNTEFVKEKPSACAFNYIQLNRDERTKTMQLNQRLVSSQDDGSCT